MYNINTLRKATRKEAQIAKDNALAIAKARGIPKSYAKNELRKAYIDQGSSLCEIETFARIFEVSLSQAGDILEDFFLEDAIEECAL